MSNHRKHQRGQKELSEKYGKYSEDFRKKRLDSPFEIRSKVHRMMHSSLVAVCPTGLGSVIDLGCGDGSLTVKLLEIGYQRVVGTDISEGNIQAAKLNMSEIKIPADQQLSFEVRDVVESKFKDSEFEVAITCHVLEHLISFEAGLKEQKRIAEKYIVVALPTAWSPISWTLLGGGNYWSHGKFGSIRLLIGLTRTVIAFLSGKRGVDEKGYAGLDSVPHTFFFPGRISKDMESKDWQLMSMTPQVQGWPWFSKSIHCGKISGRTGFGTTFILRKLN